MKRWAGVVLAVATAAATVAASGQAALKVATPFSFSLDLRTGTFGAAPQRVQDVSAQGFEVIVDGKSVALPHPVNAVAASPDGRLVAAETWDASGCGLAPPPCGRFAIWLLNRDGSGLRLFMPDARDAAWSADSRRLAFVGAYDTATLTGRVSVANVDGTQRRVLGAREAARQPTWSSSGALVAYTRTTGRRSIRIVRVADARLVAVLDHAELPVWAGSDRRLAFVRHLRARDALTLWDNGHAHILTTTAPGIETLAWSPDARRLAFARGGVVGIARADRRGARMFAIPVPGSQTGAEVRDIRWTRANELLVGGLFYGVFPR